MLASKRFCARVRIAQVLGVAVESWSVADILAFSPSQKQLMCPVQMHVILEKILYIVHCLDFIIGAADKPYDEHCRLSHF